MNGPGKPDFAAAIKDLLVSRCETDRKHGLERLDTAYRKPISNFVRQRYPGLAAQDVAGVWGETLQAVWRNVESKEFRVKGDLAAYLCKIAWCKAADVLRRQSRQRLETGVDLDPAGGIPYSVGELLEEIREAIKRLSAIDQLVMRIDVRLYFAAGENWVSLKELTREVNRGIKNELTESAVKSRRRRGRAHLGEILNDRGNLR